MFIESLARLNHRLQTANSKVTVVAFIVMPAAHNSYTVDSLKGHAVTKQLQDTVTEIQSRIGQRIFEKAARFRGEGSNDLPEFTLEDFLTNEDRMLLKRRIFALKRSSLPAVTTHNMVDNDTDPCLDQIRRCQLFNHTWDRVKIIFHPEFLSSNNPILGLDYEEFVRGCHLGVFPSYYEPWGYTPAECTVMGIPSITTNLAGFGCFMQDMLENPEEEGCYIIDRRFQGVDESINQLANHMFSFCSKTRRQRITQRNRVERLSPLLDWKNLGVEYTKARGLALRRSLPDQFEDIDDSEEKDYLSGGGRPDLTISMPGSPRDYGNRSGYMTPGGFGTLIEEMQALDTNDYHGQTSLWKKANGADEDEGYPMCVVFISGRVSRADALQPPGLQSSLAHQFGPLCQRGGDTTLNAAAKEFDRVRMYSHCPPMNFPIDLTGRPCPRVQSSSAQPFFLLGFGMLHPASFSRREPPPLT